jgi:bifunctional enzyme CysN/CysC
MDAMRQAVANGQTREIDEPTGLPGRVVRLIAGGDVGAGKSTLVARLLRESQGAQERPLPDPPAQDLLIGVAYRNFASAHHQFAVVDPPGHERYPQTLVTTAPSPSLALIVVDAREGLSAGARRDCALGALFSVHRIVLAVTKLDLVEYAPAAYREIVTEAAALAELPGIEQLACVPVSGLYGDNIMARGGRLPWHDGLTLLEALESLAPEEPASPFRLWIQRAPPPAADVHGFVGTVVGGEAAPGDHVIALPSGRESRIRRIIAYDGELERACRGQSVTLELEDDLKLDQGDLVSATRPRASVSDQFEATVVWLADEPLAPGRGYLMRVGTQTTAVTAGPPRHRLDAGTLQPCAGTELGRGDIGACELAASRRIAFDPHALNPDTGAFLLLDRVTLEPVGAGLLHRALRESQDVCWQAVDVDKGARAAIKHQRACIVWLTGLPSAGKSTIANVLERRLHALGYHTYMLDGDNVRHGLNKDLGFSTGDRAENIRRIGEVARLMVDAGLIVICAFISPSAAGRAAVRARFDPGEFIEVHVDTSVNVAEQRDPKGLYQRARRGELTGFTGVDAPYEAPENPEVHLDSGLLTPEDSASRVIDALLAAGVIDASAAAV